jgi:mannose-6-phosphate isomerase-like protein (cupin superfamily)
MTNMQKQIARFKDMEPTKKNFTPESVGVPGEAYAMIAAQSLYLFMAPEGNKRATAKPAVYGAPGVELSIAKCPPGQGAGLHAHMNTRESFMCLTGRYEIAWGPEGKEKTVLEPYDFIAVPPGEFRSFRNISDQEALLLVVVQGGRDEVMNDIVFAPGTGDLIEQRFGREVRKNFRNIGVDLG